MTFKSPLTEIPHQFKVMTITFSSHFSHLLLLLSSLYWTHSVAHSVSLSCRLFFSLLPLPSLFSLCYTVERWKSFLYPTHHSPVTINSIYVCLNRRVCEEHGYRSTARTSVHAHMHINVHVFPTHPHTHRHTSDLIHLLHNIIRISSFEMTHTARDRD